MNAGDDDSLLEQGAASAREAMALAEAAGEDQKASSSRLDADTLFLHFVCDCWVGLEFVGVHPGWLAWQVAFVKMLLEKKGKLDAAGSGGGGGCCKDKEGAHSDPL
jgi:hypothetical protein